MTVLQVIIFKYINNELIDKSLTYLLTYVNKFSKLKNIIYVLLLSLSGLPPFFLFFVKVNILINFFNSHSIVIIILIFILFFLNMIYYIQLFINKNINIELTLKTTKYKIKNFKLIFLVIMYLFLMLFSVFFIADFYYTIKLFFNWQH